jgi:hypothetical protein
MRLLLDLRVSDCFLHGLQARQKAVGFGQRHAPFVRRSSSVIGAEIILGASTTIDLEDSPCHLS